MQVSLRCLIGRRTLSISPLTSRIFHQTSSVKNDDGIVFYRWPTMKHFRLISRLKMYQLGLMGVLLPPATLSYINGDLSSSGITLAYTAAGGTLSVLLSVSYIFTSVIGEMAYLPTTGNLRLSTLTFLGNRRDILITPSHIIRNNQSGFFYELEVKGQSRIFRYSLKYGKILDKELLDTVLSSRAE